MASIKTKEARKAELEKLPVHTIALTFVFGIKPEFTDETNPIEEIGGTKIADLPKQKVATLYVQRLKGFQYSEEFTAFLKKVSAEQDAGFYGVSHVLVSTEKSEQPVKSTLRTLTDSASLLSFMLNNGPKLFLTAVEQKLDMRIQDRNFAEICGDLIAKDLAKTWLSKSMVKSVKSDIKDVVEANKAVTAIEYEASPLRTLKNQMFALPGVAERVSKAQEAAKAAREVKKLMAATKAGVNIPQA